MHGAQKIIVILILGSLVLNSGCSVFRKGVGRDEPSKGLSRTAVIYGDIVESNIVPEGIYISKARVEVQMGGVRERFNANIRITQNGQILASIRAFAGLEIGRIYADDEEVVVLDRLSRNATVYKWSKLGNEFGLLYEMVPLIFGDVPSVRNGERRRIGCGETSAFETGWASMFIMPECSIRKASQIILRHIATDREVFLGLSEFRYSGNSIYPSAIEAYEKSDAFHVKLSVDAIEVPWKGSINFEIPAGYKIIR